MSGRMSNVSRSGIGSYLMIVLAMLSVIPPVVLIWQWAVQGQDAYEQDAERLRATAAEIRAQRVENSVVEILSHISFLRSSAEQRLRTTLREQALSAHNLAEHLYQRFSGRLSEQELQQQILEAIHPLRFNHGRCGYFVLDSNDGEILLNDAGAGAHGPLHNALLSARRSGEGYSRWEEQGAVQSMGYSKHFEPLDLIIGASEPLDVLDFDLRIEALGHIGRISPQNRKFLRVYDESGTVLLARDGEGLEGDDDWFTRDTQGRLYGLSENITEVKTGTYKYQVFSEQEGMPVTQLLYVGREPAWGWTIVVGMGLGDVSALLAMQRQDLEERLEKNKQDTLLLAAVLLVVSLSLSRWFANKIQRGLLDFSRFFSQAAASASSMCPDSQPFKELQSLAKDANAMIDQRLAMEGWLRESRERLNLALDASDLGTWDWRLDEGTVHWDDVCHRLYGLKPGEFSGSLDDWLAMVHPEDRDFVRRVIDAAMEDGQGYRAQYRVIQPDGKERTLGSRGRVYRDVDGNQHRMIGVSADITEQKLAEEALIEARNVADAANEAKSRFLSSMSHELRTPLNGVLGYAQILRRDQAVDVEHQDALNAIESCGRHLLGLINDVLDLSRIESGGLQLNVESTHLPKLLDEVFAIVMPRADGKGLSLECLPADDIPRHIKVDAGKLRQILVNLLGNAVKFTEEGFVRLIVRLHGERLYLEVSDSGPGIEEDEQAEIFTPFHQATAGLRQGGSGLGLSISRSLVQALGGELSLDSRLGEGSRFWFDIPVHMATDVIDVEPDVKTELDPYSSEPIAVSSAENEGAMPKISAAECDRLVAELKEGAEVGDLAQLQDALNILPPECPVRKDLQLLIDQFDFEAIAALAGRLENQAP